MTIVGWTFLIASLTFVWGLTLWCYYRVMTLPPPEREIPEPVKEFHSA